MADFFLFVMMALLFVILPGPDTVLITQNTVAGGKKGGMQTAFGVSTGLVFHTLASVFGLSVLFVNGRRPSNEI